MDLEHSFTVNAPVDTAWSTMMDIEGVAECFPGATVTSVEGDSFEGTCKVKLGPIALVYKGSGSFVERDDSAHRAVIEAKGRDKRGNGTAGATVTMTMTQEGSATSVRVVTDLNVTGKPAQFGRGVMQDVSDKLLGQFVECLAGKFDGGPTEETAAEDSVAAAPTAGAAPSADEGGDSTSGTTAAGTSAAEPVPAAAAMPASAVTAAAAAPGRPADASSGTAGSSATRHAESRRGSSGGGSADTLDLGAAVMPTLLRGYAPHATVGLVALVLGWVLGRRGRRRRCRCGHGKTTS